MELDAIIKWQTNNEADGLLAALGLMLQLELRHGVVGLLEFKVEDRLVITT